MKKKKAKTDKKTWKKKITPIIPDLNSLKLFQFEPK